MLEIQYLAYSLVCLSAVLSFISYKASLAFGILALLLGMTKQMIQPIGALSLIIMGMITWYFSRKTIPKYFKFLMGFILLALFFSLALHLIPGFYNILFFDKVLFSEDATPFTMYLNLDKPFIGIFLLVFFIRPWEQGRINLQQFILKVSKIYGLLILTILPISFLMGYIRFDLKLPEYTWVWMLNNLLIVCMAEEALFRGFIQNLTFKIFTPSNKIQTYIYLLIPSLLFGFAHFKGGISYIILSTMAGYFYGLSYLKTKRIEAPIFIHFLLNLTHFIFFTYPALNS